MAAKICATGSCLPRYQMPNEEWTGYVETSDDWIRERTGIESRHIAKEESCVSLAAGAAKRALESANMTADAIDLLLVSTISSEYVMPCAACEVQAAIGADKAVCFDLNAACSGFILAYSTAVSGIEAGLYQTALVIGSECMSHLISWKDRSTCILFGDGAGAVILKASDRRSYLPVAHSDGRQKAALMMRSRHDGGRDFLAAEYDLQMDGQAVFKFAVRKVPEVILEVLEKNHLRLEDIRYFLLHQANRRIIEAVARRLGIAVEKFPMNVAHCGNTSSASIPILLDELNHEEKLQKGDRLVLAGFGAGLTWGATVVEW
ncbi:MAG: beta-ketoacyl-ACP synthase III [Lachnospiraceae bacterium]